MSTWLNLFDISDIFELGFNERRCIARDTFGLYGAIVTLATYVEQESRPPEALRGVIITALRHCVRQHPVLRTVVRNAESEQPRLEELPRLHLDKHLRFCDTEMSDNLHVTQRLLERIQNDPLNDRHILPQWRLWILPVAAKINGSAIEYKVAFAASHALTDGMSGFIFHSTFLEALQSDSSYSSSDTRFIYETKPPDPKLPLSLEQAVPLPISWPYFLKVLSNEVLPRTIVRLLGLSSSAATDIWLGAPSRPERPENRKLLRTTVRVAFASEQIVKKALQACRQHNARLTALVNRLTGYALADALARRGLKYSAFGIQTTIDLRRCMPNARATMANYFSTVVESVEVDIPKRGETLTFSDDDWEISRCSTERLREKSSSLADQTIALLKYISNIQDWTLKSRKKAPTDSYTTSNLGSFENRTVSGEADSPHWTVKNIVFSQSGNGTGEPLSINVASVRGGPLSLVICWESGALGISDEEVFAEEICAFVVDGLSSIGNE